MHPDSSTNNFIPGQDKLPVLFIGHGSPMNAVEDNPFSRAWIQTGRDMPTPQAVLCISAHWQTAGVQVAAAARPKTIHDFGGFPRELNEMVYPAPGSPELARLVKETVKLSPIQPNQTWGLDHGAWSVLCRMFPEADVPIVQLSLDYTRPPAFHYALGKELRALRRQGVLILGSGNMVHNLGVAAFVDSGFDWAIEFDETLRQLILAGDHDALIQYEKLGRLARLSIPTNEHYLPLLYILALQEENEPLRFFTEGVTLGSISMRSVWIG